MAIPRIASTVLPDAATPKLNDLEVDIAPGDRRVVHHGRAVEDVDGKDYLRASIEFDIEVEHVDLWYLHNNWGLVVCSQTGEIYPDVRRYTCTPGRNFSGVRASRRSDVSDVGAHAFNKRKEPLKLDATGDFYWFQGQAVFPVHAIIGSSKDHFWQSGGEEERNAWRLQLLDPDVLSLFEQRFQHRIQGFEGPYDPKRPPSPGLVPWQGMSVDAVVMPLAIHQRRLASTPRSTPEADRALACYQMARLNTEALIQRTADWRAGRPYETLRQWFERREPMRRKLLGGVQPYMFAEKPLDLAAERERVTAKLEAEAAHNGHEAMRLEMVAMLQKLREGHEALEAERAAFRAERDQLVQTIERNASLMQASAGIGGADEVMEDLKAAQAPAQQAPKDAPPKAASAQPKAFTRGFEAAAAGQPADANPYDRATERDLWTRGFESYKAPSGA